MSPENPSNARAGRHGTKWRYNVHRCRCAVCTEANRRRYARRRTRCRHCGLRRACRPGHLCQVCHTDPTIRERFCAAGRRPTDFAGAAPPPALPNPHAPGSEPSLVELERRASEGEALFAPGDLMYRQSECEAKELQETARAALKRAPPTRRAA